MLGEPPCPDNISMNVEISISYILPKEKRIFSLFFNFRYFI